MLTRIVHREPEKNIFLLCALLCSYRVRGVDGSCAKHLTVESYKVIYAANSHTYYY